MVCRLRVYTAMMQIRMIGLLGLMLVASTAAIPTNTSIKTKVEQPVNLLPERDDSLPASILYYINLHRKSIGMQALQMNNFESGVALQHSKDMAAGKVAFGHDGVESRAKAIGNQLGSMHAFGENVAYGPETAKEVVDTWLKSRPHRENIEGDFTQTGIGCSRDKKGMLYYTEIFTK